MVPEFVLIRLCFVLFCSLLPSDDDDDENDDEKQLSRLINRARFEWLGVISDYSFSSFIILFLPTVCAGSRTAIFAVWMSIPSRFELFSTCFQRYAWRRNLGQTNKIQVNNFTENLVIFSAAAFRRIDGEIYRPKTGFAWRDPLWAEIAIFTMFLVSKTSAAVSPVRFDGNRLLDESNHSKSNDIRHNNHLLKLEVRKQIEMKTFVKFC